VTEVEPPEVVSVPPWLLSDGFDPLDAVVDPVELEPEPHPARTTPNASRMLTKTATESADTRRFIHLLLRRCSLP
jgi:hypothetical protein